jgi:hypothetical protein
MPGNLYFAWIWEKPWSWVNLKNLTTKGTKVHKGNPKTKTFVILRVPWWFIVFLACSN